MKMRISGAIKSLYLLIAILMINLVTYAQESVSINTNEISSWFSRNWIWVSAGILLLLILAIAGTGSSRKRKTTTVIKDEMGNVKSVTTTEVRE